MSYDRPNEVFTRIIEEIPKPSPSETPNIPHCLFLRIRPFTTGSPVAPLRSSEQSSRTQSTTSIVATLTCATASNASATYSSWTVRSSRSTRTPPMTTGGLRDDHSGAKLHVTGSLSTGLSERLMTTEGPTHERREIAPGDWVTNPLILFDLD